MRTSTTPIVTRPLHRASTEPTVWGKPVARTQSVATIHLGLPKNKIQLFLSHNNLSVLPSSLFRAGNLENLTVLSLRNNNLTYLPPEINRLIGLEEFSVGQNRIQYLPAEMLQMKLKSLHLIPNPFMTPPPSRDPHSLGSSTVSKTTRITGSVPSLAELLLRFLLSPVDPMTPDSQTMLEAHYELPIPEEPASHLTKQQCPSKIHFPASLPPFVRSALNACLPGSVYLDEEPDSPTANRHTDDVTGIGMCPSPLHQRHGTPRLFVMHAEERYTWEAMVAGVEMGGSVPVRWRGCKQGCLDFLNPSEKAQLQLPIMDPENGVTESPNDDDDPMGVVQMVQLAPAHSEDFDDE
ncbi:hypothetical protein H0H93_010950 [Arthromyces matolae]|nr:hypothetical protein H0H93_010950 [Arthromyces matolae]